jgi:hypothetical protein
MDLVRMCMSCLDHPPIGVACLEGRMTIMIPADSAVKVLNLGELNWCKEKERLLTTRLLPRHKKRIICFPKPQDLFILTRVMGPYLFIHMLWCKKRALHCLELLDLFILTIVSGVGLNLIHVDLTTASTATSDTNLIAPLTNSKALSSFSIENCDEVVIKEEESSLDEMYVYASEDNNMYIDEIYSFMGVHPLCDGDCPIP